MSLAAIIPSSRRVFRAFCKAAGHARVPLPRLAEARARISEREQVDPRELDFDLNYDRGECDGWWCDVGGCIVCDPAPEVVTPPLRRPLLARAA